MCVGGVGAFGWLLGMKNDRGSVLLAKLKKKSFQEILARVSFTAFRSKDCYLSNIKETKHIHRYTTK